MDIIIYPYESNNIQNNNKVSNLFKKYTETIKKSNHG